MLQTKSLLYYSVSHLSGLSHRGAIKKQEQNHLIRFPHRSYRTYRSHRTGVRKKGKNEIISTPIAPRCHHSHDYGNSCRAVVQCFACSPHHHSTSKAPNRSIAEKPVVHFGNSFSRKQNRFLNSLMHYMCTNTLITTGMYVHQPVECIYVVQHVYNRKYNPLDVQVLACNFN